MIAASPAPTCWIMVGPDSAGKTTFALQYLPQVANCRNFVNADAMALVSLNGNILEVYSEQGFQRFSFKIAIILG